MTLWHAFHHLGFDVFVWFVFCFISCLYLFACSVLPAGLLMLLAAAVCSPGKNDLCRRMEETKVLF